MKKFTDSISHKNINGKLMVLTMPVTIGTLLSMTFIFLIYDALLVRDSLYNELKLVSEIIGKRTAPALEFSLKDKGEKYLNDLQSKSSIDLACLYGADSKPVAKYPSMSSEPCPEFVGEKHKFGKNYVWIQSNILSSSDAVVGGIYVRSNLSQVYEHFIFVAPSILVIALVLLLLHYLITHKIGAFLAVPLQELTDAARSIRADDTYSVPAKKYYDDEIGELVEVFNDMMVKVNKHKETLSTQVKEKTRDLQKSNKELKETLQKLEENHKKLTEALQVKENFISNMSHEIRTPSHAMLNMGEFVLGDFKSINEIIEKDPSRRPDDEIMAKIEEGEYYSEKAYAAAKRQANLLADVIDIKKMGEGKMSYEMKEHDFVAIAKEVKGSYYEQEQLKTDFPSDPIKVTCDHGQIKRVIDNFISNAIKYAPEGDIVMRIREGGYTDKNGDKRRAVHFSLKDSGVGVPPEELEYIFGKFNESSSTKNKAGGKGLGLAICEEVIKAHNGKIWAENNKDGVGSTFHFMLPC